MRDFNVPVDIVEAPIVREPDGLAVSSRNVHLSRDERRVAVSLYRALCEAQRQIEAGRTDANAVREQAAASLPAAGGLRLEYLEIVDPEDMQPVGAHHRSGARRRRPVGRRHAADRQPAVRAARLTRQGVRGAAPR